MQKVMKLRHLSALLALVLLVVLAGCSPSNLTVQRVVENGVSTAYPDKDYGHQLDMPTVGDTIAVMHTSMGDITLRFFPEAAPKAVQNFTTHAKNGYYDGLTFHRVMKDFMIQGGDPKGDGTGGESIWDAGVPEAEKGFEDEFDQKLLNLRGSISMANSGVNTNGSQFFINQSGADVFDKSKHQFDYIYGQYKTQYDYYAQIYSNWAEVYPTVDPFILANGGINPLSDMVPDKVWDLYEQHGGNIHLDGAWRASGGHTVFGQVIAGMDVVDAIASVSTDSSNNKPLKEVTITSIEITTYQG